MKQLKENKKVKMLNNILDSYKGNNKRQNNKGNRITKKRVIIVKPKDVKGINVKKCNATVIITLIDEEINLTVGIGRIFDCGYYYKTVVSTTDMKE